MSKAVNHDDIDLMRYADGQADSAEAGGIASFIDSDGDARLKLEALDQMSDVVRSHLELAADEVEPRLDAMWAVIEQRIQANGVAAEAGVAVRPAAARTGDDALARRAAEQGGVMAALKRFFGQYRGHFLTGAVAAGAAAALIMALRPPAQVVVERPVAVRGQAHDQGHGQGSPTVVESVADRVNDSRPAQVQLVDDPSPPQIEQLEVNGGSGTVFVMPREGDDDVAATVIFLETDDVEGPL